MTGVRKPHGVMSVGSEKLATPLRLNRDFTLLWTGQVISGFGTRIRDVAMPLLVLAVTGSPAKAGIVGFAGTLPSLLLAIPAGAIVDRLDKKKLLIACDIVRFAAFASLAVALAAGFLSFALIILVEFIDDVGYVLFMVAERSALPSVVDDHQLSPALARNQARDYAAFLAGQPVGALLFAAGRSVPFVANAISYAVSVFTLSFLRTDLSGSRSASRRRIVSEAKEGIAFYWREPFLRTSALLVASSGFVLNGLYLVVIVLAKQRGASPQALALMFVFLGCGGVLGAAAASRFAERVSPGRIIIGALAGISLLLPLLVIVPGKLAPGFIYGGMFFLFPTWNAVIGSHQLRVTPQELRGRVQGVAALFSLGPVPFAYLLIGVLLQAYGTTTAILVLLAIMIAATLTAAFSRGLGRFQRETAVNLQADAAVEAD